MHTAKPRPPSVFKYILHSLEVLKHLYPFYTRDVRFDLRCAQK